MLLMQDPAVLTASSGPLAVLPLVGPLGAEKITTTLTQNPGTVDTAPVAPAKKSGKMRPGTTNTARYDCGTGYQLAMVFLSLF